VQGQDQGQLVACHDETERNPKDDGEKTVAGAEGSKRIGSIPERQSRKERKVPMTWASTHLAGRPCSSSVLG
jgi:hypothetical protein